VKSVFMIKYNTLYCCNENLCQIDTYNI